VRAGEANGPRPAAGHFRPNWALFGACCATGFNHSLSTTIASQLRRCYLPGNVGFGVTGIRQDLHDGVALPEVPAPGANLELRDATRELIDAHWLLVVTVLGNAGARLSESKPMAFLAAFKIVPGTNGLRITSNPAAETLRRFSA
jgi:hypothetical protein